MSHTPIKATGSSGKDFELVPAGTHFAICTKVIYIGIQEKKYPDGTKEMPEVYIGFEIPDVQVEYKKDGKDVKGPAVIGRTFTLNIGSKSNLGPFLVNWRGKSFTKEDIDNGFDITSILGKVCNLGVIHEERNGKTYANITSAGSLMKIQKDAIEAGTLSARPHGELLSFNADEPDPNIFEVLPKFLKNKIAARITTTKTGKPLPTGHSPLNTAQADYDDDIPF